ncbi:MAG: serine protease, partial [Actinomycetota bacterium]|nr:serine protease [Actinomycetota bacterium]
MARRLLALAAALAPLAVLCPSAQAIVGGKPAPPGKYPFFAVLEVDDRFSCGASLVAPDTVLTAAHCVTEDDDSVTKASRLSFVIGRDRLSDTSKGEDIPAAEVIRHEDFDSSTFENDVALVRLSRPSTAPTIRLADPATERDRWAPRKPATVIGHGGTFFPGIGGVNTTDDLHEVQVPMVSDQQCDTTVGIDETSMVCAGNDLGGADSCNGDSGGPLMVTDAAGAFIQVGTVSFGTGCGFPTQYGVYGRVGDSKLHDWVTARIAAPAPAPSSSGSAGGAAAEP